MKIDHQEIHIIGMDCADCANHVQKALADLPEVSDAKVYLGAEKAVIYFDGPPPEKKDITQAVRDAGYQVSFEDQKIDNLEDQLYKSGKTSIALFILIIAIVLAVVIIGEQLGLFQLLQSWVPWYIWAALIILGGLPIFKNVWKALLKKRILSHTLMTASTIAAVIVGEWATGLLIVLFMRLGNLIEKQTTEKARQAVRELQKIAPHTAHLIQDGTEKDVDITSLQNGSIVLVKPGESIPVDGTVTEGLASVDQSAITGESMPLEITTGHKVFAATILQSGMLKVQTTGVGKESHFGRIIHMVEEAEANRGDVQQLADRFSAVYLPIVAAIAIITYLVSRNAIAAAAVMAVSCSCSFSLATPVAMLASIGSAAQKGLLFKGGKYIENLAKVDTVFLDKTGTLTLGMPVITKTIVLDEYSEADILQLAASVERYSAHPLSQAVLLEAQKNGLRFLEISDFESIPGKGVNAKVGNLQIEISSKPINTDSKHRNTVSQMENSGLTLLFVHINGTLAAILGAEDVLRDDVKSAIETLKTMGVADISLLSGDKLAVVKKVADYLEIDFHAELKPQEKIGLVKSAQAGGRRVLMIGDGINDAPALAQADVGIAMGASGSSTAIETSHVVLLREDWKLIPYAFEIARNTMRVVRSNIIFTMVYNLIGLSFAAIGFVPPAIAAGMQSIPDIGIMANSARLLRQKK